MVEHGESESNKKAKRTNRFKRLKTAIPKSIDNEKRNKRREGEGNEGK